MEEEEEEDDDDDTYFPYGPYGLYRASVPIQGCTLPYLSMFKP